MTEQITTEHVFEAKDVPIHHATIYSSRAEISRIIADIPIMPGTHTVKLLNPKSVLSDTIRVSGTQSSITLIDVEYKHETVPVHSSEHLDKSQLEEAKSTLKSLETKLETVQDTIMALQKSKGLVDQFANKVVTGAAATNSKEGNKGWDTQVNHFFDVTLEQYQKLSIDYSDKLYERERELSSLNQDISNIQKKIRDLGGDTSVSVSYENINYIEVTLEAKAEAQLSLQITYMVTNAKWVPLYDVRAETESEQLELTYKANISQSTGEDWLNTSIELSTAEAVSSATIPSLNSPWSIYIRKPTRGPFAMLETMAAPQSAAPYARVAAFGAPAPAPPPALKMVQETSEASKGFTSATFKIPSRQNIPSDNVNHKVTVAILTLQPVFTFTVAPKLEETVYMTADVKNDSEFIILPGVCSIYLDGSFISKSRIENSVSPNESFDIALGKDVAMKVTYRKTSKENVESGHALLGNQTFLSSFTSTTSLKNTKRIPVVIKVLEQIPTSSNEKIKVNWVEPSLSHINQYNGDVRKPAAGSETIAATSAHPMSPELFLDNNVVVLHVNLAPNESKDVKVAFTVQYPRGEKLTGL